ncbi:MAG TPA: ABC transporter permease subunit [Anaerolineaceae bacterium]|nr:ABC transporter permease subunit [Anaerolineaceae bacterium]
MAQNTKKRNITPYLFISPGLIILLVGFFIPIIMLFSLSFFKYVPGSGLIDRTFTFENYARFADPYYLKVLIVTFRIALGTTILSLILGFPMALMINRARGAMKTVLLVVILTPLLTNVVARTLGLMIVLGRHGPINQVLELLDVPKFNFIPSEIGIVIGLTQVFMPYMILSINSVLSNIDFSLQEAARDLGSSASQAFWKVIFPLSVPGIIAGSLFVFLLSFSSYVTPRLLGGGQIMVMTMLIYQQATALLNWPFAAAAALILLIFTIIIVTSYTKIAASGDLRQDDSKQIQNEFSRKLSGIKQNINEFFYSVSASISRFFQRLTLVKNLTLPVGRIINFLTPFFSTTLIILIIVFIILPLPLVILSSFSSSSMITFPPSGYSTKWYTGLLDRPEYIRSFLLSVRLASLSTVIALTFGTLASLGLSRYNFPGREFIRSIFLSPLMLPAVIVGIALLRFLVEVRQTASFQGLLLAHLVLTTAYVVRTVSSSLVGFDNSLQDAARDLGASAFHAFRTITLPLIKPGLIVAGIFAFITSFDETTVSIFITGGRTITLPVRIFSQLEYGLDPTVTAISSLLIVMALIAISIIGKVFGLEKFSIR